LPENTDYFRDFATPARERITPLDDSVSVDSKFFEYTYARLNDTAKFTKTVSRENMILRMAAQICHELYMTTEFADLQQDETNEKKDYMNF
jgi:hypothetical protein